MRRNVPQLLKPDVWTGKAKADALEPMRKKQAEIHWGSRRRYIGPHSEAGYTSANVKPNQIKKGVANRRGPYTSTHDNANKVAVLAEGINLGSCNYELQVIVHIVFSSDSMLVVDYCLSSQFKRS